MASSGTLGSSNDAEIFAQLTRLQGVRLAFSGSSGCSSCKIYNSVFVDVALEGFPCRICHDICSVRKPVDLFFFQWITFSSHTCIL